MKKYVVFILLLWGQVVSGQNLPAQETIEKRVNLVNLKVSVEQKGKAISGLTAENFQICVKSGRVAQERKSKEDCEARKISVISKDFSVTDLRILIDTSGSTNAYPRFYLSKFSEIAALRLFQEIRKPNDTVSIWTFNDSVKEVLPWKKYSPENAAELDETIKSTLAALRPGGYSAIFDALYVEAKDRANNNYRDPSEKPIRITVVFTDGINTFGWPILDSKTRDICPEERRIWGKPTTDCEVLEKKDVVAALQESDTLLFVIDFSERSQFGKNWVDIESGSGALVNEPGDLGEIAEATGGRSFHANSLRAAESAFRKIVETINNTYVLSFYLNQEEAGWYTFDVKVGKTEKDKFVVNNDYKPHYERYRLIK